LTLTTGSNILYKIIEIKPKDKTSVLNKKRNRGKDAVHDNNSRCFSKKKLEHANDFYQLIFFQIVWVKYTRKGTTPFPCILVIQLFTKNGREPNSLTLVHFLGHLIKHFLEMINGTLFAHLFA